MTLLHTVCPHCSAVNRFSADKISDQPVCGKCGSNLFTGQPQEVNTATFDKQLRRSEIPLLVDFWAPWCGPCRMMAPEFARAAQILEPEMRLLKVNTEEHPELAQRYAIRSIPTMAVFMNGEEVARQAGATNASGIAQWARQQL